MTAAEANRRQAEIWAMCDQHENDLMRPVSGDDVCTAFSERVKAFCERYGVDYTATKPKHSVSNQ